MNTYKVRQEEDKMYLVFNLKCYEDDCEALGENATHKMYPLLLDGYDAVRDTTNLVENDWVYIKNNKILHIDEVPAQIKGREAFKVMNEFTEEAQRIIQDWKDYLAKPRLLDEEEDKIYCSREERIKRLQL